MMTADRALARTHPRLCSPQVLMVLLLLMGLLVCITLKNRGSSAPGFRDCMSMLPTDLPSLLVCLAQIPGICMEIPGAVMGLVESLKANRKPAYGRLPADADDELDLGDDEMDDEAEELRDGDMYEEDEPPLSTLPMHTPQRPSVQQEGSLLGEEFTSPLSGNLKKGD
jgi:hypothetical protein